jgi:hypothetical protein
MSDAADANYAVIDAADAYHAHLKTLNDKVKEAKGNQQEINALYREGALDAKKIADAQKRVAEDTATANGTTAKATELLDLQNASMLVSAHEATPAQRKAILDYIAVANNIPAEKLTDVRALIDQGKIAEAEAALAAVSVARTATITADADVAKADADLNAIAERDRVAKIIAKVNMFAFDQSGGIGWADGYASGTNSATAGAHVVGEHGPELVNFRGGESVTPAGQTARILNGATAPSVTHVTVNTGLDDRKVIEIIKRYTKNGGQL